MISRKAAKTQRKFKIKTGQSSGLDFDFPLRLCGFARVFIFLFAITAFAQDQHVTWTLTTEPAAAPPGSTVLVRMAGKIDEGWHLYSMSTPAATPTKVQITGPAVEKVRDLQPAFKRFFDPNFESNTESYEGEVAFLFEVQLKKDAAPGPAELAVSAKYQTCNPKSCVPSPK